MDDEDLDIYLKAPPKVQPVKSSLKKSNETVRASTFGRKKGRSEILHRPTDSKRKSKEKPSIFSFWKSKAGSDKFTSLDPPPRSKIREQQDRITELETELEQEKSHCKSLEQQVAELNLLLQQSRDTVQSLKSQLDPS